VSGILLFRVFSSDTSVDGAAIQPWDRSSDFHNAPVTYGTPQSFRS
jgi:hypothetical protein